MKTDSNKRFEAHVFVCTHKRDGDACCSDKNAQKLRDDLKKLAKECSSQSGHKVRINNSGCIDRCKEGIATVIYPQGIWVTGLQENDAPALLEVIKQAVQK